MSYGYTNTYNKPSTQTGGSSAGYETPQSDYTYTTIQQGAYGTYTPNAIPEINKEYYGYGGGTNYNMPYPTITNQHQSQTDKPPTRYGEYKAPLKRKYADTVRPAKKLEKIAEYDEKGDLVMFVGRDQTYPDALNAAIHPASCDLCNMKMNSVTSAKDHYESKAHDKNITTWIAKNYTEKGLTAPEVKRYYRQGPAGPEAFHCDKCDLKLTSLTHANQHYSGKKHQMVLSQRSKPSGAGFYNNEGKWVRLGTKANPQSADRRFGIGEQFQGVPNDTVSTTTSDDTTSANATIKPTSTTTTETEPDIKPPKLSKVDESDPNMFCAVCKVSVTSALQMTMHLSGTKHQKKIKASGVEVTNTGHVPSSTTVDLTPNDTATLRDNVLNSVIKEEKPDPTDLSMYRTPSGQYYCQTCNITITNLHALEQHLKGKRHLKSQVEEKAMAALAGRNTKLLPNKIEMK